MSIDCIFCRIRDREIPKDFTYEDEEIMVFPDIHPAKPVHLLVVPKKHISDFLKLEESHILEKVKKAIQKMVREHKLEDKGYRLIVNGGGAQIIHHLHFHLMGPMGKQAQL